MALKSWGLELWDQVDKVFYYCHQGFDQAELFYKTISDIHKIQCSLAKKYKGLNMPNPVGKSKLIVESTSYLNSFNKLMLCMTEQSSVHDLQAEEIRTLCVTPMKTMIDELKTTLSAQLNKYNTFKNNVEQQKKALDRSWTKYYTAFIVRRKADAQYHKVKDDKNLPRIEIDKIQNIAQQKAKDFQKILGEYAFANQNFNESRATLYLKDLPEIISVLELMDRKRAEVTSQAGQNLVKINRDLFEKSIKCQVDDVANAISEIDHRTDSQSLLDSLSPTNNVKLLQPPDMVFVNLETFINNVTINLAQEVPGILQQGGKIERGDAAKSLFGYNLLKGIEIKDLLPEQIKRRINDIDEGIKVMEKKLTGLKTLFTSFERDPGMGDKSSLEPEIDVNERQLLSLKEMEREIKQYRENNKDKMMAAGSNGSGQVNKPRMSRGKSASADTDDESFDEDEDEEDSPIGVNPANKDSISQSSASNRISMGPTTISNNGNNSSTLSSNTSKGSVKMARVLYAFDATDPVQQMSIQPNIQVVVLAYDDGGSGWSLVQDPDDSAIKGYVPTNYIQLE